MTDENKPAIEITQPTDLERGEVNETTLGIDLDTLIPEQLKSHCLALRLDHGRRNKKIGELQSTCEFQGRTIAEQSETLNNRGALLQEIEHDRDGLLQRIDELTEEHERVKAVALESFQKGNDIKPLAFAEALDTYALAVARISSTDAHPQIVVALVQMAMHIRGLETMSDIIKWLHGSR